MVETKQSRDVPGTVQGRSNDGPGTVQGRSRDGPGTFSRDDPRRITEPLSCQMKFHSHNYFNIGILPSIIALCSNKFLPLFLLAFPQSYSRTLSRFLSTTFASLNRKVFKKQKISPIYEFSAFKFDSFLFEKKMSYKYYGKTRFKTIKS